MNYPYNRIARPGKYPRIEVGSDSMRVGKTTAVRVIAQGLREAGYPVYESYEDWQNNPFLKGSYVDPANNFLDSQKWFVQRKWEQVREGAENSVYLQDVHPEMDYCYAATNYQLGRMSKEHFREYHAFYNSLAWTEAPAPDLLVYLTIGDEGLVKRAMMSRRKFETVDNEYFLTMKRINREWLAGLKGRYHIKIIEADRLDFANNEKDKKRLIQEIRMELSKLDPGWR